MAQENGALHPIIEAPREIVEYLNRGPLTKLFDKVGYCIYNGVVVCEEGKKDAVIKKIEDSHSLSPQDLRAVPK